MSAEPDSAANDLGSIILANHSAAAHHGRDGAMTSDNESAFDDDQLDVPMRHNSNKKKKRVSRYSSIHGGLRNN